MGGLRGSMESEGEEADSKKVLAKRERGHRRRKGRKDVLLSALERPKRGEEELCRRMRNMERGTAEEREEI